MGQRTNYSSGDDDVLQQLRPIERMTTTRQPASQQVHNTTFYERFKFVQANRPIVQKKLDKMIEAIKHKNFLPYFPIVVSPKFEVLEGQHRLKAAEYLRLPIYYMISNEMGVEDVSDINEVQDAWKTSDHLNFQCEQGNKDYLTLRSFMAKWSYVPIRVAINLTMSRSGNANDAVTATFKRGEYVCSSLEFAEQVAAATFDFAKWFKHFRQQSFIFAIAKCMRNPNYDHKRMMQKMEYLSTRLVRCSRMEEYLEKLEEIYNHKVTASNRVWLTE
jgi:hypothetical protein